jgi:hypothetical protein
MEFKLYQHYFLRIVRHLTIIVSDDVKDIVARNSQGFYGCPLYFNNVSLKTENMIGPRLSTHKAIAQVLNQHAVVCLKTAIRTVEIELRSFFHPIATPAQFYLFDNYCRFCTFQKIPIKL